MGLLSFSFPRWGEDEAREDSAGLEEGLEVVEEDSAVEEDRLGVEAPAGVGE